jgi:hypothetical protein
VATVDVGPATVWWDPEQQTIYMRRGAPAIAVLAEVVAILADLGAEPDAGQLACWCGDPVSIPGESQEATALRLTTLAGVVSRGA